MTPFQTGPHDRGPPEISVEDRAELASYRDAVREQWIQARRDLSSTFGNFSAGGVALLVTLLSTAGLPTPWAGILYAGAFGAFIRAIHLRIRSLEWDTEYLKLAWGDPEGVLEDMEAEGIAIDRGVRRSFWTGVIFAVLIAGMAALHPFLTANQTPESRTPQQEVIDEQGPPEGNPSVDFTQGDTASLFRRTGESHGRDHGLRSPEETEAAGRIVSPPS